MRHFYVLVILAVAFGSAAMLYEQESRKVRGVLGQITELQAKVGDLQAEVNRLNEELEAVKQAGRGRPNLKTIASQALSRAGSESRPVTGDVRQEEVGKPRLVASDVTTAPPAIRRQGEDAEDDEWNRPTVDAEQYRPEPKDSQQESSVTDPYR